MDLLVIERKLFNIAAVLRVLSYTVKRDLFIANSHKLIWFELIDYIDLAGYWGKHNYYIRTSVFMKTCVNVTLINWGKKLSKSLFLKLIKRYLIS